MKLSSVISTALFTISAQCATLPADQSSFTTLTPTGSAPQGAATDFTSSFGIGVLTLASSGAPTPTGSSGPVAKRDDQPDASSYIKQRATKNEGSLSLKIEKSVLSDESGRIGSIVSNRQFQFDGPPPQAGAIYAAGWSITPEGVLALGDQTIFYQCLSGNFYNLYDENVAEQCHEINLQVVGFD
ncbi:hypothetical protein WICANDRAFT_60970 [Wickerhamomyces anomalus NRRL Y-366-8]|uniref:Cell wall mannoprotein PIR1-like C-terminal domain-containing protein n=1 Tax=Wickerhamomyces anomalus (strain ATCC 58044 / CBS 1984 / NCYC 433 / NRRL Y-366-8) TaxID=683960 RepID=A0A1E3PC03_WICAA|nr:uncharacterized protein WICANDRAFT_60970 [Wickerhamomyces anomalus NRRL Y-366-8]ODQ62925.1 hypothetical protein WICANDRAFT_60970 [Wickerhamomyces anomalus NRRL Y-366-8]